MAERNLTFLQPHSLHHTTSGANVLCAARAFTKDTPTGVRVLRGAQNGVVAEARGSAVV